MRLSNCLWLILLPALLSGKGFLTVKLSEDLGEQLFQIASTSVLAEQHGLEAYFPEADPNNPLFSRVNKAPLPGLVKRDWIHPGEEYKRVRCRGRMRLVSPLMSYKYFDGRRPLVKNLFTIEPEAEKALRDKYGTLYDEPTVALYVQTSTLSGAGKRRFVNWDYYTLALRLFPQETKVLLFSDEPALIKERFAALRKNLVVIEESPANRVILMSWADHQIISNCPLSWWGAYLNERRGKIVVAPRSWNRGEFTKYLDDLLPKSWIQITVNDE